jgi:hypothetical protein
MENADYFEFSNRIIHFCLGLNVQMSKKGLIPVAAADDGDSRPVTPEF